MLKKGRQDEDRRDFERIARIAPFDFVDPWPTLLRAPPGTH